MFYVLFDMADFIELTEDDGSKITINIDHIIEVMPYQDGSVILFDVTTGNDKDTSPHRVYVSESYQTVKRKIGL